MRASAGGVISAKALMHESVWSKLAKGRVVPASRIERLAPGINPKLDTVAWAAASPDLHAPVPV